MALDDVDDVRSRLHAEKGRKLSQVKSDFEAGFKSVHIIPKETVADNEGNGNKEVPKT